MNRIFHTPERPDDEQWRREALHLLNLNEDARADAIISRQDELDRFIQRQIDSNPDMLKMQKVLRYLNMVLERNQMQGRIRVPGTPPRNNATIPGVYGTRNIVPSPILSPSTRNTPRRRTARPPQINLDEAPRTPPRQIVPRRITFSTPVTTPMTSPGQQTTPVQRLYDPHTLKF